MRLTRTEAIGLLVALVGCGVVTLLAALTVALAIEATR